MLLNRFLYKVPYFKYDCQTYPYKKDVATYTANNDCPCFNKCFYKIHFAHLYHDSTVNHAQFQGGLYVKTCNLVGFVFCIDI